MSGGTESSGSQVDELPLREGAIFGAAAYVVGYVTTYVLLALDGDADLSELAEGGVVSSTDVVGWIFYNAHFVDTEFSGMGFSAAIDFLSEDVTEFGIAMTFQFPTLVYRLVPIVVLVVAGYMLLDTLELGDVETAEAAKAGATLAAGYLPLALLGAVLFTVSESDPFDISIGPETTTAILLAGIVFPVVFGAIGAAIHTET